MMITNPFASLFVLVALFTIANGNAPMMTLMGMKIASDIIKPGTNIDPAAANGAKTFALMLMRMNGGKATAGGPNISGRYTGGLGGSIGPDGIKVGGDVGGIGAVTQQIISSITGMLGGGGAGGGAGGMGDIVGGLGGMLGDAFSGITGGGMQLTGSVFTMWKNLLSQYGSFLWGMVTGSKGYADGVQAVVQTGLESFFKVFGGLGITSQTEIVKAVSETMNVLNTVLKLRMGPMAALQTILPAEIKIIKDAMESQFGTVNQVISSVGMEAPTTVHAFGLSSRLAQKEFAKQRKMMSPKSNKALGKMIGGLKGAQLKVGKMVATASPKIKKDLGIIFNVIKNTHMLSETIL